MYYKRYFCKKCSSINHKKVISDIMDQVKQNNSREQNSCEKYIDGVMHKLKIKNRKSIFNCSCFTKNYSYSKKSKASRTIKTKKPTQQNDDCIDVTPKPPLLDLTL